VHKQSLPSAGSLPVELGIPAFQLVPHQFIRVDHHLLMLYLQYYETRHWLSCQSAECASHRPWVYQVDAMLADIFQLVGMPANQYFYA